MAGHGSDPRKAAAVERAIALMTEALDLIDAYGNAPEAGAHLDLALQMLRKAASESEQ